MRNENCQPITLCKGYVDKIYQETFFKISTYVNGKKIWVSKDETADDTGRFIVNVIVVN